MSYRYRLPPQFSHLRNKPMIINLIVVVVITSLLYSSILSTNTPMIVLHAFLLIIFLISISMKKYSNDSENDHKS